MQQSKYHAKKIRNEYGIFDSKKEYARYIQLKQDEKNGLIKNLRRQVSYELIPSQRDIEGKCIERACKYVADFVYEQGGKTVVEDAKGFKTEVYKIKRKLMLQVHGIRIKEV